jgi:hypothetical protein
MRPTLGLETDELEFDTGVATASGGLAVVTDGLGLVTFANVWLSVADVKSGMVHKLIDGCGHGLEDEST